MPPPLPGGLLDRPPPSVLNGSRASGETGAPPPSVLMQQSSRCSGSEIIGELSTSSTVTAYGNIAFGLCWAWVDAATLIQASCSLVVPYSYMCRDAFSA